MKVCSIIFAIYCPVAITAKFMENNVQRASSKYRKINLKPSDVNLTAVEGGMHQIRQCMKACLFTADCLTTVFDEDLDQCSLYNSLIIAETLSDGETAVIKDSMTNEVLCIALEYHQEVGGCIQIFTQLKTWEEAQAACHSLHQKSHLVTIADERKQLALNKLTDSAGVTYYHTDGRAIGPWSKTYVWNTTGDRMTYTNWKSGEPDNANGRSNEDCLAVKKLSTGYQWVDVPCTFKRAYICELG